MTAFEEYVRNRIIDALQDFDKRLELHGRSTAQMAQALKASTDEIYSIIKPESRGEIYDAGIEKGKDVMIQFTRNLFKNFPEA